MNARPIPNPHAVPTRYAVHLIKRDDPNGEGRWTNVYLKNKLPDGTWDEACERLIPQEVLDQTGEFIVQYKVTTQTERILE